MYESLGDFGERRDDTHATMAEQAASIPFDFDLLPEDDQDTHLAVALLSLAILKLQTRPGLNSANMFWRERDGFSYGYLIKQYGDDSRLTINFRHATQNVGTALDPVHDDEASIRMLILHPEDRNRDSRAIYRIPLEADRVICETDRALGLRNYTLLESLSETETDEDFMLLDFDAALVALSTESTMADNGEDPDTDSDIVRLRETNSAYRVMSDSLRSQLAAERLGREIGMDTQRLAGPHEIYRLIQLFDSL